MKCFVFFIIFFCFYSCGNHEPSEKIKICYPSYDVSLGETKQKVLKSIPFIHLNDVSNSKEQLFTGYKIIYIDSIPVKENIVCTFRKNALYDISIVLSCEKVLKDNSFSIAIKNYFRDFIEASDTSYKEYEANFFEIKSKKYVMHLSIYLSQKNEVAVSYKWVGR